jgi:alkylation response protein AidB-like acyl-CoA dehydrogenase
MLAFENDVHNQVRDLARRFTREKVMPNAVTWDEQGGYPRELIAEMGALGFMGITVPEEWGGAGLDNVASALVLEEISAGCGAMGIIVSGHNAVGCMPILEFGTDDQKERYLKPFARGEKLTAFALTEPTGGSDVAQLKTRAERHNDRYVLNGTKQFITSGSTADVALIFATTDANAARGKGITGFIVPTDSPGYVVDRVENKMGLKASDTCVITLDGLEVPFENRLGEEGQGYKIALSNLEGGRIGIGAQAVGIARAALEAAIDYARQRVAFGVPISEHQAVAFRLADMATELEAARQLVLYAARLKDNGQPSLQQASMAKLKASEMAEQICSDAIQTFGGYGYMEDYPVARLARDARGTKIYEGANDIQRLVISRALLAS